MDSSQTSEDDTIRDTSESGYVATRPRFTRARRTWKANWRYLTLEDIRALQNFRDNIVKRGALAFYFPSLVKNGSFEIAPLPGSGQVADMWDGLDIPAGVAALTPQAFDGNVSVSLSSVANQAVGGAGMQNASISGVQYVMPGAVANPGDTLGLGFWYLVKATSQQLYYEVRTTLLLDDGGTPTVAAGVLIGGAVNTAWQQAFATVVVPTPSAGQTIKHIKLAVTAKVANFATQPTLAANEVVVLLDAVGVAVTATAQKQALMVGSSAITRQVRFTKLPEFADLSYAGGVKRYGCTFEVTEL